MTKLSNIDVAFLNVCSLTGKVREVADFIRSRGINVMALAETWLKPDVTDGELSIPHFTLHRKDRCDRPGGGVAIYCHETLNIRRRKDLESDLEVIWIEISDSGRTTLLGCVYRPPSALVEYWQALQANISQAMSGRQTQTILVGDFNVDLQNQHSPGFQHLHQLLVQFDLTNYVTSATRVTSH